MPGQPIQAPTVKAAIAHGIAYATEDRKRYGLNLIDDIKRNISGSALGKLASWGHVDANRETVVANGFRTSMRIKAPDVGVVTGKLSGGNQQKVVLGKWFLTEPRILLLDEPTRGVDVGAKREIYRVMSDFTRAGGAVIMISSETDEVLGMADRVLVIHEGRLAAEFSRDEASEADIMRAASGLGKRTAA